MRQETVAIDRIIVERDARQRKELPNLEDLAASIARVGLVNPIHLTHDYRLVAGERRFTACSEILGWTHIPATIGSEEEELPHHFLVEFEENVARQDLTWQEYALAILNYHRILSSQEEGWNFTKTAQAMGMTGGHISQQVAIAEAIEADDREIVEAERMSVARNLLARRAERAAAAQLDEVAGFVYEGEGYDEDDTPEGGTDSPTSPRVEGEVPVAIAPAVEASPFKHADFNEWAKKYTGPKFNFLHCDFPYGIDFGKMHGGAANTLGGYEDSKDVYVQLLDTLEHFCQYHVSASAHMIFWYSMTHDALTRERLTAMGWKVATRPLIWYRSDNSGILPDPKRGPRWNYETALFCSRGDRPIVRAKSDCFPHPNTKRIHSSEKPVEMLEHFLTMVVDSHTVMLDPTMGSGNAVVVSENLGAKSVLGLERDEEYYKTAVGAYKKGLYFPA